MLHRAFAHRVASWLVRRLPADFRSDFGDSMHADLTAMPAVTLWTREIPGLLAAIGREYAAAARTDVAYALRLMRRTPGFTVLAIGMLALGTGVNVTMFSVIDAVMLHSPFTHAEALATARTILPDGRLGLVPVDRLHELETASAISGAALVSSGAHTLTGLGEARAVDNVECVTPAFFDVLGARPLAGRTFAPDDDQPGAPATVMLSYTFWQALGASPSLVGSTVRLNDTPTTVIGVMPRGFYGALARPNTQAWLPYHRPIANTDSRGCRQSATATTIVRLAPGVTRAQAAALVGGFQFEVLESVWMDDARTPLKVLAAAVVCVLLIACLNVGGLQMERTLARRRELTVRLSLGAGRGRLVRQLVTESLVFALAASAAGLGASALTMSALTTILPANLPYAAEIAVNGRALAIALAVGAASGLLCGLFPAIAMRDVSASSAASGSTRTTAATGTWTRRVLVVGQITLSLVVLVGAGLMIRTFATLRPDAPGFDADHKLWQPARPRAAMLATAPDFYERVFAELRQAPSVRNAAGSTYVPMVAVSGDSTIDVNGTSVRANTNSVTPNFFALMHIALVAGRPFANTDTLASDPVVVVNERLARQIDPGGAVIGKRIVMDLTLAGVPGPASPRTIVGVIANIRGLGAGAGLQPSREAYLPAAQTPRVGLNLIVDYTPGQQTQAAAAVRAALLAVDPQMVVKAPSDIRAMIDRRVDTPRFGAWLLTVFGLLALALAALGLFMTIGWWVAQRTREIGVRLALGATRADIAALIGRHALALTGTGVAIGIAAAAVVTRYMQSWLYGVTPLDRTTFAGAVALMVGAALLAIAAPVRRASRVDPAVTLRQE